MTGARAQITAGLILSSISGACFVAALQAPQPGLDPLGPGGLPMATALVVLALSVVVIVQAVTQAISPASSDRSGEEEGGAQGNVKPLVLRPLLLVSVLTIVYVVSLAVWRIPYWTGTTFFVALVVWTLNDWRLSSLPKALISGAILGFGCDYFFTQVFIVDLP